MVKTNEKMEAIKKEVERYSTYVLGLAEKQACDDVGEDLVDVSTWLHNLSVQLGEMTTQNQAA